MRNLRILFVLLSLFLLSPVLNLLVTTSSVPGTQAAGQFTNSSSACRKPRQPGIPTPPVPAPIPTRVFPRFGAVEAFVKPDAATALGVDWERIIFSWPERQPNGTHDFEPNTDYCTQEYFKNYFDKRIYIPEATAGRQLVGLLKDTPAWASTTGKKPGVPKGLYLPWNDPGNYWGHFTNLMAQNYQGRVKDWVIWNIPDVPGNWDGSVGDYYQLVKVAYLAIKAGNPQATVHLGGVTFWQDIVFKDTLLTAVDFSKQYFFKLLDLAKKDPTAAANNYYFDIMTLHLYDTPTDMYYIISNYKKEMNTRGIRKEIWINEMNASPSIDGKWSIPSEKIHPITLTEQAAFIIQAYTLALAAGATSVSVTSLADSHGIIRPDGTRRPAFLAYQTLIHLFLGFKLKSISPNFSSDLFKPYHNVRNLCDPILFVQFSDFTNRNIFVVWNVGPVKLPTHTTAKHASILMERNPPPPLPGCTPPSYPKGVPILAVNSSSAHLYDMTGNSITLSAHKYLGELTYFVPLPGFTCLALALDPIRKGCDVEGIPFILVE